MNIEQKKAEFSGNLEKYRVNVMKMTPEQKEQYKAQLKKLWKKIEEGRDEMIRYHMSQFALPVEDPCEDIGDRLIKMKEDVDEAIRAFDAGKVFSVIEQAEDDVMAMCIAHGGIINAMPVEEREEFLAA